MNDFHQEHANLQWSWDRHSREKLDRYLVAGVEDPRINCQSILTRALVADTLWPGAFSGLIDDELRFGLVLTWIQRQLADGVDRFDLLDQLDAGDGHPPVITETWNWLQAEDCPVPDYMSGAFEATDPDDGEQLLGAMALDTYTAMWKTALAGRTAEALRIVEAACGSANDYRFFEPCGLAAHLEYTGFDLSSRNVENARKRFPGTAFATASLMDAGFKDEAFDYFFVHDLYEHLSIDAMEQALRETVRIVKREAWLHFFNLADIEEHEVRPLERYHWNLLSLPRVLDFLGALGVSVEVMSIPSWLEQKFGYADYHNREAVTLLLRKA